jgi:hypothetical protein
MQILEKKVATFEILMKKLIIFAAKFSNSKRYYGQRKTYWQRKRDG